MTEPTIDIEEIERVSSRMQAARELFGDEFDVAYRSLLSLDEKDPAARMVVAQIWYATDPGKCLMDWWYANFTPRPTLH